jgi:NAD+ diphosphatase
MPVPYDFGRQPALAYVGSKLDRAADRRSDAAFLEAAIRHPEARAVVIGGELIVLRRAGDGGEPWFEVPAAQAFGTVGEPVLLGAQGGSARLGLAIASETAETLKARDDLLVADLRSIAIRGLVAPEDLQPIAVAKAVLTWHARHRFCSNCGAATQVSDAGWRRDCGPCGAQHFPRTDPCVIMLAIDGERCLLARSARFPPGMWSCLAGFMEPGESFEEAVRRETLEEAGIEVGRVVYFASQPWPFPMSIMIGCHAEAISTAVKIDPNEIEDGRWFSREEAAQMLLRKHADGLTTPPPAAVAHHIIRAFVERGVNVLR